MIAVELRGLAAFAARLDPDALALHGPRLAFKLAWGALGLWVLFAVCLPSQQESWRLWLANRTLADATAAAVVLGSGLIFTLAGWALRAGEWGRGAAGMALGVCLFAASFYGQWNFYLHQGNATLAAVAEIAASGEGVKAARSAREETRAELAAIDAREAEDVALLQRELEALPAARIRSRAQLTAKILSRRESAEAARAAVRAAGQSDGGGTAARLAPPPTAQAARTDARPADQVVADAIAIDRRWVAAATDAARSAIFEVFALIFAALALARAPATGQRESVFGKLLRAARQESAAAPAPESPPERADEDEGAPETGKGRAGPGSRRRTLPPLSPEQIAELAGGAS